ncbi:MAG: hypothetical protein ACK40M_06800 [Flavobacteriales bacterium]
MCILFVSMIIVAAAFLLLAGLWYSNYVKQQTLGMFHKIAAYFAVSVAVFVIVIVILGGIMKVMCHGGGCGDHHGKRGCNKEMSSCPSKADCSEGKSCDSEKKCGKENRCGMGPHHGGGASCHKEMIMIDTVSGKMEKEIRVSVSSEH